MERPQFPTEEADEKPLDPAAEKVRRKLVRFVAVNLGILFVAVMAVLGAVVYKVSFSGNAPQTAGDSPVPAPADTPFVEAEIALPAGARILSQSLSGERIALHVALPDGQVAIFVYDLRGRRLLGRYDIRVQ
ncbi:fimbrial protein [Nitratireductor sp. CAU 1489]|uniref:Fimbrial protein n=1 Tax=Nitratireductor arenosus TaxID=2682096 RepID=A0A844Q8C5_9HYPH|nr:fimbrial protein [Nitratireductor arenosus]MVA96346.1 fimbrial protein [Nitratireductor arenosus]